MRAKDRLTVFSWGYHGWGSAVPQLAKVTAAIERKRGFGAPLFVDVRYNRRVRAPGFRETEPEKRFGPNRYVWMSDLGNAAIGSADRKMKIARPSAAGDLLDLALNARKEGRRIIFFCSCPTPRQCHRWKVGTLLLGAAKRRGIGLDLVEWPGGKPADVEGIRIRVPGGTFKSVLKGRRSIPLPTVKTASIYASLPWGAVVTLKTDGSEVAVSVEPARADSKGWHLPLFLAPVLENDTPEILAPHVRRERSRLGYEERSV
jgi:hypothetical protein